MIDSSLATVEKLIVHRVGNKLREEGTLLSEVENPRSPALDALLCSKFLEPMQQKGQWHEPRHETDLALNVVNRHAHGILEDPEALAEHSQAIAKHLYGVTTHPKVAGGELLVVMWDGLRDGDQHCLALGLFKMEEKSLFLDVRESAGQVEVGEHTGIATHVLQKGALFFSTRPGILVIDNLAKHANYWLENFLKAAPLESPKSSAQAAGSFLKAVTKKIESPDQALELAKQVRDNMADAESVSFADLKKLSASFVDAKDVDAIATKVQGKLGYQMGETATIPTSDLARYSRDVTSKARIIDGVSLVIAGEKAEITHITVKNISNRVTATIELQVND